MEYGLNSQSAISLSTSSLIISGVVGDFKGGNALAKKALEIRDTIAWCTEVRTPLCAHAFTLCWTEPIRDQLNPLLRAYEVGFRAGDVENASWAIYSFCFARVLTSFQLDLVLADCLLYMIQMKNLNGASQH